MPEIPEDFGPTGILPPTWKSQPTSSVKKYKPKSKWMHFWTDTEQFQGFKWSIILGGVAVTGGILYLIFKKKKK